jgi:ATP-dependent Lhr-like helicase
MRALHDPEIEKVEQWFAARGWTPFDFQRQTWHAYRTGESGLVHAPTGMGKTYAVWLGPLLEYLSESSRARDSGLPLRVLWITPLRALANDTATNLQAAVDALNIPWQIQLRTGDTTQTLRKKQRAQLPPALITTPESLSVMLSYPGSTDQFRTLKCVIVDEWHELLGTKRGVQTELGLARLRTLSPQMRTWGLSATLGNLEEAMAVLLGRPRPEPGANGFAKGAESEPSALGSAGDADNGGSTLRVDSPDADRRATGTLIRGDYSKEIAVETLRPEGDSIECFPWSGHIGTRMLHKVIERIEAARTTLLFTNVRSQAEIWFQQILKARPDLIGQIALHHGSLDRDIRRQVEDLLRAGNIRCVVCTSSLDLGVDFSPVDQVMQLGSPKGIARMMQRAGRSGHQPGAVSTIIGVPTNALELVEFAAAREAAGANDLRWINDLRFDGHAGSDRREDPDSDQDSRTLPDPGLPHYRSSDPACNLKSSIQVESRPPIDRPLDVLVQHLVTIACGDGFEAGQLRDEVRSTRAFATMSDDEWNWAMHFVSQGGNALRAYPQYAKILEENGRWRVANKSIERLHRMSIGTITSDNVLKVSFVSGGTLGTIEESFISRIRNGDRFVFAGRVLELVRVHNMVAHVRPAKQRSGVMPKWMGSRCPLSTLLAEAIRKKLDEARRGIFNSLEMQLVRPLLDLQINWSAIPKPDELLIERYRSRDGHHVFIYPFDGRQVHEGLSSLIAHRIAFDERSARSLHVTANDYGIELVSRHPFDLDEDEWRQVFTTDDLVNDLLACLNTTALARRAFRDIARVAGLIFSGYPGQPKTMRQLQASSQMFFDVFSEFDPGNLLLDQARREVLDRELDVTRLRQTLERMRECRMVIVDTPTLTPLSFPLWAESIRTQYVTGERWEDRVKRMVVMLEKEAAASRKLKHGGHREHREIKKGRTNGRRRITSRVAVD